MVSAIVFVVIFCGRAWANTTFLRACPNGTILGFRIKLWTKVDLGNAIPTVLASGPEEGGHTYVCVDRSKHSCANVHLFIHRVACDFVVVYHVCACEHVWYELHAIRRMCLYSWCGEPPRV